MIIIITGATHTGKTQLAQRLMEEHRIPYFSMDHLKMGLIRSHNTELSVEDDEKLTEYLWPILREMIKTAIENSQSMIVEGCYVPFDWKKDFDDNYLKVIKFVCLCMSEEYIDLNYKLIIEYSSVIESRLDDEYCTKELLIKQNSFYLKGCEEYNLPYYLINDDYDIQLSHCIESIGKINNLEI